MLGKENCSRKKPSLIQVFYDPVYVKVNAGKVTKSSTPRLNIVLVSGQIQTRKKTRLPTGGISIDTSQTQKKKDLGLVMTLFLIVHKVKGSKPSLRNVIKVFKYLQLKYRLYDRREENPYSK